MTVPLTRTAIAISYIKGKRVDRWSGAQTDLLMNKVHQQGYLPTDGNIWLEFLTDFRRAYADTAAQENALTKLNRLDMTEAGGFDDYVLEFDELLIRAQWERNTQGTLNMFKQGMPAWLYNKVLEREILPQTLDEWIAASRSALQRAALKKVAGPRAKGNTNLRDNMARNNDPRPTKKARDPDAMDVDAMHTSGSKMSKEERTRLMKEGKCFICKQKGHLARD